MLCSALSAVLLFSALLCCDLLCCALVPQCSTYLYAVAQAELLQQVLQGQAPRRAAEDLHVRPGALQVCLGGGGRGNRYIHTYTHIICMQCVGVLYVIGYDICSCVHKKAESDEVLGCTSTVPQIHISAHQYIIIISNHSALQYSTVQYSTV
jgi:hypothetical protein